MRTPSNPPRWAMVCGVVRQPDAAQRKLLTLARWRDEGLIDGAVFCWWHSESAKHPELVQAILDLGFLLVELEEPRLKTVGHTIHQAKSWWYALHAIPAGAHVLKLRPDLGELPDWLPSRLDAPCPAPGRAGWPDVFQERIRIHSVFPASPLYINDIIFYGLREDLLTLASFDLSSEYVCSELAPEHFFFRAPFARRLPLLDAYFPVYQPFVFDDAVRSRAIIETSLRTALFCDALATHLVVLETYFDFSLAPEASHPFPDNAMAGHSLADILIGKIDVSQCAHVPGPSAVSFRGPGPVRALLAGQFGDGTSDDLRFREATSRCGDFSYVESYSTNPLIVDPRVREFLVEIQARFGRTLHKTDLLQAPANGRFLVRGSSDRLSLLGDDPTTQRLAAEINFLRRKIDEVRGVQK